MNPHRNGRAAAFTAFALAVGLCAGCSQPGDNRTPAQGADTVGTTGDEPPRGAREAGRDAAANTREAAQKAGAAMKDAGEAVADAAITTAVKSRIVGKAAAAAAERINVDTRDHVVTLTGTVATEREKAEAVAAAREIAGVREVRDRLTVQRDR
jgi:hyperosmotically inducible protein